MLKVKTVHLLCDTIKGIYPASNPTVGPTCFTKQSDMESRQRPPGDMQLATGRPDIHSVAISEFQNQLTRN